MLSSHKGSDDGINGQLYEKGKQYEVGESLFNSFKNMGACKLVDNKEPEQKKEKESSEDKEVDNKKSPSEDTKAVDPVKENKEDNKTQEKQPSKKTKSNNKKSKK